MRARIDSFCVQSPWIQVSRSKTQVLLALTRSLHANETGPSTPSLAGPSAWSLSSEGFSGSLLDPTPGHPPMERCPCNQGCVHRRCFRTTQSHVSLLPRFAPSNILNPGSPPWIPPPRSIPWNPSFRIPWPTRCCSFLVSGFFPWISPLVVPAS